MPTVSINYWAVIIAAAANIVLGMLWYGPILGKQWKKLMGFTEESLKSMKMTPAMAMVGGTITALLMSYVLAHSIAYASAFYSTSGVSAGMMAGFWSWLGFAVPLTLGIVLWEGKSWKLWVLNAGFWLVSLLLMGGILGGM